MYSVLLDASFDEFSILVHGGLAAQEDEAGNFGCMGYVWNNISR